MSLAIFIITRSYGIWLVSFLIQNNYYYFCIVSIMLLLIPLAVRSKV